MGNKCLCISAIAFLTSCTYTRVPNYLKKQFKYSPAEHKEISNKININGFYRDLKRLNAPPVPYGSFYLIKEDTSIKENRSALDVMLFPNGLCLNTYLGGLKKEFYADEYYRLKGEITSSNKPGRVTGFSGANWGIYEVSGDTLKIKVIGRGSLMTSSVWAYENYYKIIDNNTLLPLQSKSLNRDDCHGIPDCIFKPDSLGCTNSKFYPLQDISIDPNYSWLMNKKWFWKNKEEYKDWKKGKMSP